MVAWTGIARHEHSREGLRYPSDMTDAEWALIMPFVSPAKRGGRPRTADMREVVNAILYIALGRCAWRLLPKCFPPVSTVRRYFYAWRDAGLFEAMNTVLVMNLREIEGREASPSAGVIDSQSVKTTESGRISGYDAGKESVLKSVYLTWPTVVQLLKRRSARRTLWRTGCGLQTIPEHSA
ncbi:transposase, partial [Komagataeibacter oboediens]|uniref:transposase n=1 Tax=Komagataeibacter oboediens TaxID=65958 RepID=UPI0020C45795